MTPTLGFCDGKMEERSGGLISLWSVRHTCLSFLISMLSPALSPGPFTAPEFGLLQTRPLL